MVLKPAGGKFLVRYAPVASDAAAKLGLSLATLRRWKREQRDVVGAYLNAAIVNRVIFMKQPTGHEYFGPGGEEFVCVLNKAFYGLRQTGHLWHEVFSDGLKELGLKPLPVMNLCLLGSKRPHNTRVPFIVRQVCSRRKVIVAISVYNCHRTVSSALLSIREVIAKLILYSEKISIISFCM